MIPAMREGLTPASARDIPRTSVRPRTIVPALMFEIHTPTVSTHGRYIVEPPRTEPAPVLVGFHGYAEDAEAQLERLRTIPGVESWLVVSIQGLHRFYRGRDRAVVASWMTRQDRELLIADNLAYVTAVLEEIKRHHQVTGAVVFAGFSQGVAMAFRSACRLPEPATAVIAVGGNVPPELDRDALARIPAALVGRGVRDEAYAKKTWQDDQSRLRAAGVDVRAKTFGCGHEWTGEVSESASTLLGH